MISIEKLNQFYGESHTLWDLNIEANKGDCLAIMGRNGVGKTTLVESIMGLIPVESGKILFQNENANSKCLEFTRRKQNNRWKRKKREEEEESGYEIVVVAVFIVEEERVRAFVSRSDESQGENHRY